MPVAVRIRFVTGEYHATAWDQAVNSGVSEWPPSPWRLLRGLLSTWHTRCPEIPADSVARVIEVLAQEPPRFLLPATKASHTRHYLPQGDHRSDDIGGTSLTLAPRLQIDPEDAVIVHWPTASLDPEDRLVLDSLVTALPYLGRAESRCAAILLDDAGVASLPERGWSTPGSDGPTATVLCPEPAVTRAQLETTPDQMRKAKRLTPAGARWVPYRTDDVDSRAGKGTLSRGKSPTKIHAARWVVDSRPLARDQDGILITTGLRGAVLGKLGGYKKLDGHPDGWIIGGPHQGDQSGDHQHAHWWWRCERSEAAGNSGVGGIREVVMWVPEGIPPGWVGAIAGVEELPRFKDGPRGYRSGAGLHLQALGDASTVLTDLTSTSRRWRSRTPLLFDRHPKRRQDFADFVRAEIDRELSFRAHWWGTKVEVNNLVLRAGARDRSVLAYRRYRWKETMGQNRPGALVEVELSMPVAGPLALGALCHFGFGLFEPVIDTS